MCESCWMHRPRKRPVHHGVNHGAEIWLTNLIPKKLWHCVHPKYWKCLHLFLIFCQLKTVDNIKRSDLINFDDFCYDIIWYYALVCLFLCFSSSSVFVPPCVFPCVSVSLCYLTCPFHSSLTSPVPDLLISVSVYLVFVLPALLSVSSIIRHPSASVLPVMFGSVSPSLSSYVPPIGMFGFWFLFSLVIWKMPFSLHLATLFFF